MKVLNYFIKYENDGKIYYSSAFNYNPYAKQLLGDNELVPSNYTKEEFEIIVKSVIKRYKEDKLDYLENLKLEEMKKDF